MLFSSSIFLFAFLPAVLLGYYVVFRGMRRAQTCSAGGLPPLLRLGGAGSCWS